MAQKIHRVNLIIEEHLWHNLAIAAANVKKTRAAFIRDKLMAACVGKAVPEQAVPLAYNYAPGAAVPAAKPVGLPSGWVPATAVDAQGEPLIEEPLARPVPVAQSPWANKPGFNADGTFNDDDPYWAEVTAESKRRQAEAQAQEDAREAEEARAEAAARAEAIRAAREADDHAFEVERILFDPDELYASLRRAGEEAGVAYALVREKCALYNVNDDWEPLAEDIDSPAGD
jgi:hypothetical protein